MRTRKWCLPVLSIAMLLAGCGGEAFSIPAAGGMIHNPGTGGSNAANWQMTRYAIVTAGLEEQPPSAVDDFNGHVGKAHLGPITFTRGYEFTTPANTPFSFSVIAREDSNSGAVRIRAAHANGGIGTMTGAESIMEAGMLLEAPGLFYSGDWFDAAGDGVLGMTVRGSINSTQVLVFETITSHGSEFIAVRLRIGGHSDINMGLYGRNPGTVKSQQTIYSSDDHGFGLPAIAVSGDRYSVTCYDGNATTGRNRVWLQMNAQTSAVTGGATQSASPDSGSWRDQEIAALHNVLAIAYTGNNQVQVEVSLDRGATFGTPVVLNESATHPVGGQRLVQVELADDYTLAVAYWRSLQHGSVYSYQLCVVEGTPTGFDSNFTPTGYSFGAPWVVHSPTGAVVPVILDLEYSTAGDLVVGYGYNAWGMTSMELNFRCATKLATGQIFDYLIETFQQTWGCDPSVSIVGTGIGMSIFYAFELPAGIRMIELRNLGATPYVSSNAASLIGSGGCYMPSVHARMQGNQLRVDLLYLEPEGLGWSLRRWNFPDWSPGSIGTGVQTDVFTSTSQPGGTSIGGAPGMLVETVGFMGYDAVTHGDDVAIALHTLTHDLYAPTGWGAPGSFPPPGSPTFFSSPGTPTLLPGMTNPVPAPNPNHRSQLKIVVLD